LARTFSAANLTVISIRFALLVEFAQRYGHKNLSPLKWIRLVGESATQRSVYNEKGRKVRLVAVSLLAAPTGAVV
jgi:hypothetical protein